MKDINTQTLSLRVNRHMMNKDDKTQIKTGQVKDKRNKRDRCDTHTNNKYLNVH